MASRGQEDPWGKPCSCLSIADTSKPAPAGSRERGSANFRYFPSPFSRSGSRSLGALPACSFFFFTVYIELSGSAESEDGSAGPHAQKLAGRTCSLLPAPSEKLVSPAGCGAAFNRNRTKTNAVPFNTVHVVSLLSHPPAGLWQYLSPGRA